MDKKDKVKIGLLAGLTTFSVTLGNLFDSAEELKANYPETPKAVVESIDDYSEDNLQELESEHDSFKEKLKKQIYRIPIKIRAIFFVPLWALGSLLIALGDLAISTVVMPVLHLLLGFIIQTLIMILVVGICIKLLFPDMPWSKIFSKKMIISVIIASIILKVLDFVLPYFIDNYRLYKNLVKFTVGLILIGIILKPYIKKKIKEGTQYKIVYDENLLNEG